MGEGSSYSESDLLELDQPRSTAHSVPGVVSGLVVPELLESDVVEDVE